MKWMKQAAKYLATAGLAACLLLACAAPASAASLQTPVWMQAWADTRTGSVIGQLEKDQFTAEIKVDGMNGVVYLVRSNGKMYWKASKLDGTEVLCLLVRDGSAYQLDHTRQLAIRLGDESAAYSMIGISEQAVEQSLSTGKATGFTSKKKTVNGLTYDAEVFDMQLDGKPVEMTYCYDNNGVLRYLITNVNGKQASMEYRKVSDKVDESLLKIPAGYTVCSKAEADALNDVYDEE